MKSSAEISRTQDFSEPTKACCAHGCHEIPLFDNCLAMRKEMAPGIFLKEPKATLSQYQK